MFIYPVTDGKAFVIIVKVVEGKFEKQTTCFTRLECIIKYLKLFQQKKFCHL